MKKILFAMALLIFLAAVSYASTSNPMYKHQTGSKGTHHIVHPVDHFTI